MHPTPSHLIIYSTATPPCTARFPPSPHLSPSFIPLLHFLHLFIIHIPTPCHPFFFLSSLFPCTQSSLALVLHFIPHLPFLSDCTIFKFFLLIVTSILGYLSPSFSPPSEPSANLPLLIWFHRSLASSCPISSPHLFLPAISPICPKKSPEPKHHLSNSLHR